MMGNNHKLALHVFIRCVFGLLFAWLMAFQGSGVCVQHLRCIRLRFGKYEFRQRIAFIFTPLVLKS